MSRPLHGRQRRKVQAARRLLAKGRIEFPGGPSWWNWKYRAAYLDSVSRVACDASSPASRYAGQVFMYMWMDEPVKWSGGAR